MDDPVRASSTRRASSQRVDLRRQLEPEDARLEGRIGAIVGGVAGSVAADELLDVADGAALDGDDPVLLVVRRRDAGQLADDRVAHVAGGERGAHGGE
jgi:hypothetical protein